MTLILRAPKGPLVTILVTSPSRRWLVQFVEQCHAKFAVFSLNTAGSFFIPTNFVSSSFINFLWELSLFKWLLNQVAFMKLEKLDIREMEIKIHYETALCKVEEKYCFKRQNIIILSLISYEILICWIMSMYVQHASGGARGENGGD